MKLACYFSSCRLSWILFQQAASDTHARCSWTGKWSCGATWSTPPGWSPSGCCRRRRRRPGSSQTDLSRSRPCSWRGQRQSPFRRPRSWGRRKSRSHRRWGESSGSAPPTSSRCSRALIPFDNEKQLLAVFPLTNNLKWIFKNQNGKGQIRIG